MTQSGRLAAARRENASVVAQSRSCFRELPLIPERCRNEGPGFPRAWFALVGRRPWTADILRERLEYHCSRTRGRLAVGVAGMLGQSALQDVVPLVICRFALPPVRRATEFKPDSVYFLGGERQPPRA